MTQEFQFNILLNGLSFSFVIENMAGVTFLAVSSTISDKSKHEMDGETFNKLLYRNLSLLTSYLTKIMKYALSVTIRIKIEL